MKENNTNKKQTEATMALYRLLRLQNRENNFLYRDQHFGAQLRVSYPHFPLETIAQGDLLKTFWKFITTHYFKKIDEEELERLNYIRSIFRENHIPQPPQSLQHLRWPQAFFDHLAALYQSNYLQEIYDDYQDTSEGKIWLKKLFVNWTKTQGYRCKKTKQISKRPKPKAPFFKKNLKGKSKKERELEQKQKELDQMINELSLPQARVQQEDLNQERDNIDEEIKRLQKLLQKNSQEHLDFVYQIEAGIIEEEEQDELRSSESINNTDAECLKWLIHNLEEKQIAESVAKIVSCERKQGQPKFVTHYENALNLVPMLLNERQLKKLNQLRETSLLKFYRTGGKSTHSYICHNYAGFSQMQLPNRTGLTKSKDKDYLQMMKKIGSPSLEIKQSMNQFDICHHCKYMYLPQFLVTCKFSSHRLCMPKISQNQTDFGEQLSLQKGRVSQRFVSKHRNCMTGYAKINEQYVCGRKFCLSCLKDNYGQDWMKLNNGICPFCDGICSCTRCLRNEKMNKLKALFISLGGDISSMQSDSLIDQLPVKKTEIITKVKGKAKIFIQKPKITKTKTIKKTYSHYYPQIRNAGKNVDKSYSIGSQQIERWSSTAQKQLMSSSAWRRSSRRASVKIY